MVKKKKNITTNQKAIGDNQQKCQGNRTTNPEEEGVVGQVEQLAVAGLIMRRDDGWKGRRSAGFKIAGGRYLSERHQPVGKTQHRAADPRMAGRALHPMRQLQLRGRQTAG